MKASYYSNTRDPTKRSIQCSSTSGTSGNPRTAVGRQLRFAREGARSNTPDEPHVQCYTLPKESHVSLRVDRRDFV